MHAFRLSRTLALPAAALLLGACASVAPLPRTTPAGACERYLGALDAAVRSHRVNDAGAWPLPGFPHLRSTRFLASFREQPLTPEQERTWLERLRRTDTAARAVELRNLPAAVRRELRQEAPLGASHRDSIADCGEILLSADLARPARLAAIRARAAVPDNYRGWQRVLGLYPLTQLFLRIPLGELHRELAAEFALPLDELPRRGVTRRYVPAPAPGDAADPGALLRAVPRDALGIPAPDDATLARLFERHAPVWEVEQAGIDDHIGRLLRSGNDAGLHVDPAQPVGYRWHSYTRFDDQVLLQLNYLVWLPARTAATPNDIYAGPFDGVIWRLTLRPDGRVLAADAVHACGCYYLLFPTAEVPARPAGWLQEPVLAAQTYRPPQGGARTVLRLRAGDHYLQRVYPDLPGTGIHYDLLAYRELLSLAGPDGRGRRVFDSNGILRASERPERKLLWPFGIDSAGAMRRNGTHAIAFIGRRHFDDARLFEELLRPSPR